MALPIRVTYWDNNYKPCLELACTYDISPRGARITGLGGRQQAGDIVAVERGRNKAYCRVVWLGTQEVGRLLGLQCVESEKTMWETELRELEEFYDSIARDSSLFPLNPTAGVLKRNRRRHQRFSVEGAAQLLRKDDAKHVQAVLKDLSEMGCLVSPNQLLAPDCDLNLVLNVANCEVNLKGKVRHTSHDLGVGIEFSEIRKGDRAVIEHLLRKMAHQQQLEEYEEVPVIVAV